MHSTAVTKSAADKLLVESVIQIGTAEYTAPQ